LLPSLENYPEVL